MHSKDAECILIFLSAMPRGVSVAYIYVIFNLMHSKDAECILMFLSAMPRGVSVAHIYAIFSWT